MFDVEGGNASEVDTANTLVGLSGTVVCLAISVSMAYFCTLLYDLLSAFTTPNCIILEKTEFYPFGWQPTH